MIFYEAANKTPTVNIVAYQKENRGSLHFALWLTNCPCHGFT